jgi:hypothetical protein
VDIYICVESLPNGVANTHEAVMAHELFGHAYFQSTGRIPRGDIIDPNTGDPLREIWAVNFENLYRSMVNLELRQAWSK